MIKHKKHKQKNKKSSDVMGFVEHITEFRNRLVIVVVILISATVVSFNFSTDTVMMLTDIAEELGYELVYLAPAELFTQYIRLSLISGIVFSSPVILYETWAFIRTGLKKSENIIVFLSLLSGLGFFVIGALFAFYVAMPLMLNFFINVDKSQTIEATISIQNYLSFVMTTLISFGVVFEMPIITVLLTQLGLIRPEWLKKGRSAIIVVIFVVGAIITPPDMISQTLVSIPMLILFEISVVLSKIVSRNRMKKNN